jgi:hypothetical protein
MKKLLLTLVAVLLAFPAHAQSTLYSNSSTGNVGIGTMSPAGTLDVEGGTAAASTNGSTINIVAQNAGTSNQNGGSIFLTSGAGTGTGGPGYVGLFSPSAWLESSSNPAFFIGADQTNRYGAVSYATSFDALLIQGGVYGGTTRPIIMQTGGGNVGIANTSPSYLLHVGSSSASGIVMGLQNSSGTCTYNPGASSITVSCSSDRRLKSDIDDTDDALSWIDDMRIRDFTVKSTGERRTGVIAQEMIQNHPDMVHENTEGFYSVDEPNPWLLVKTIQELHGIVSDQQGAITRQQAEISELKQAISRLTPGKQQAPENEDH